MAERDISLPTQIWYANGEIGVVNSAEYRVQ